jgi:hypothetical protein
MSKFEPTTIVSPDLGALGTTASILRHREGMEAPAICAYRKIAGKYIKRYIVVLE